MVMPGEGPLILITVINIWDSCETDELVHVTGDTTVAIVVSHAALLIICRVACLGMAAPSYLS